MLSEKQYADIRKELDDCTRPLFFFHDDPDGVCSFLLFYRYVGDGKGVCVKSTPRVDMKFYSKVEEYQPDKIFVLDLAMIDEEFLAKVKVPIIWVDHHTPQDYGKAKYFNPRVDGNDNIPASYLCYKVVQQDMWIGMIGCIGDWFYPDFAEDFKKEYPDLVPSKLNAAQDILFDSKLGEIIMLMSFVLKGKTTDVNKCIKIMTRISNPMDYLNHDLAAIKFLMKKYLPLKKKYDVLLEAALKKSSEDPILLFLYQADTSLTKELSNNVQHKEPEKLVIICRDKSGEMKCSLRAQKYPLSDILEQTLVGINGFGGGHEHACGAVIKKEDFGTFVDKLRDAL